MSAWPTGPQTASGERIHAMKYRDEGEGFNEAVYRLAFALKDDDIHYHQLRRILLDMRFLPGGRIQVAMGSSRQLTPFNCYVSGVIDDSYVGPGSIMARATEAAATLRMGGGIGYDFSTLRPKGDMIKTQRSASSGPVNFMSIFNEIGRVTASAGNRSGAQMGVMRIDHPDIEEFINAKHDVTKLRKFNMSIAVTDEFMEAMLAEKPFDLKWGGRVYRTVDALELWEKIMRSTWNYAEPGVFFIDTTNRMNNLWYDEQITATNPCGEQPLPPYGACLLGSYNLVRYLVPVAGIRAPGEAAWKFDWEQLHEDIPPVVRGMDNVVDKARYPLVEQRREATTKRRMGIGVTGLANAGEALGHSYGSPDFLQFERMVLGFIRDHAYVASARLAAEKGAFTMYDEERYLKGEFIMQLDPEIRDLIKRYGIRNSHLTSIAPTGTISLAADNTSSGLEPVFFYEATRPVQVPGGFEMQTTEDFGVKFLGTRGKLMTDVTADEHVATLVTAQRYIDSAVSKTINMDGNKMTWPDFKMIYQKAWEGGAKGCTTFNVSGAREALITSAKEEEAPACIVDPVTGARDCG